MIGQFQFAELQAISYAITREKAPIYTMGSADPRAYSRNKRGIAGNWSGRGRSAAPLNVFHNVRCRSAQPWTGTAPQFSPASLEANAPFASSIVRNKGLSLSIPGLVVLPGNNNPRAHARAGSTIYER